MKKVDLITGFLGAGKTTFLLKYARFLMGRGLRIGILEYDFGAVNVDMINLGCLRGPQCELEMIDASGDADSIKRRLKTKLIAMAMSGYDRVIIEPSGVFDMDMFFDMLREEPLENWYEIGSVISVVNPKQNNLSKEADFYLASQVACSGCVLFSRSQLSSANEIEEMKNHIISAASAIGCDSISARYIEKDWEHIEEEDYLFIMNSGYHISDYMKINSGAESSFEAFSILKYDKGCEKLRVIADKLFADINFGNIMRVKGFTLDGDTNYRINATTGEFRAEPVSGGQSIIIVIGAGLKEDKIRELFD